MRKLSHFFFVRHFLRIFPNICPFYGGNLFNAELCFLCLFNIFSVGKTYLTKFHKRWKFNTSDPEYPVTCVCSIWTSCFNPAQTRGSTHEWSRCCINWIQRPRSYRLNCHGRIVGMLFNPICPSFSVKAWSTTAKFVLLVW